MSREKLPHLVYLHGFLSSPASKKARETALWMQEQGLAAQYHCPELPPTPLAVKAQLQQLFAELADEAVCVVGSSLGGFYATWAAEEFGCRAVLINPAVRPYDLLKDYIGPQRNYQTGEIQMVDASFANDLRALERQPRHPENYWLLVQTGDETLDYRAAVAFYHDCRQSITMGGDHGYAGYAGMLPHIWKFARGES